MPRVVHLTSVHRPRDPRIFVKQCRTLAAAGYDVTLVAPGAEDEVVDGVRFVPFPLVENRVRRIAGSSRRMADLAESLGGDVFHIHDPELLPAAHRLARRGATVVYDSHEHLTKSTAGKPYLPTSAAPTVGKVVGVYEHFVTNRLSAVVGATPTIAEQFDPRSSVVVANYPIANEWLGDATPSLIEYQDRPRRAVYIGGITQERCATEMTEAAGLLHTPGAEIHFAGPVSGTSVPAGPGVVYRGVLPRPEVGSLLASSRVGLVIFRPIPNHIEALPTKTFEYMASGLPVVVSSATAVLAEIVEEIGCGLVVPHDSPVRIAAAIDELIADTDRAFDMGVRGRAAVLDSYSWERQATKLLDLYSRIAPIAATS